MLVMTCCKLNALVGGVLSIGYGSTVLEGNVKVGKAWIKTPVKMIWMEGIKHSKRVAARSPHVTVRQASPFHLASAIASRLFTYSIDIKQ
ncbi:hypothetical protein TIFTF001_033638 [Ficus carica]|uniref:Uncharacterized protein n=1 Tax=Ficus carica TaxID=3494 RepID=A0AA88J9F6_FICCA|nr:hypothetical protein TIFTF001_033638 [Ficus carica]